MFFILQNDPIERDFVQDAIVQDVELADGTWKIIEAGDGGVSGLSPGQDYGAYYKALYHAFDFCS